ncbi:hypothetical protein LZ554_009473 [Drepanopeziza brunnea f. sp. 'monogermtubi']|nr:hypothetical protein LZ554_009473 [Drepanopeziza brunnea f. sp. 'monogermtubi']
MNFDPRRAAGKTVIMFSCGGRADGGGAVTNSQLFNFPASDSTEPLTLQPINAAGTCLAVTTTTTTTSSSSAQDDIAILDQAPCQPGDLSQTFTISQGAAKAAPSSPQDPSSPGTGVAPASLKSTASSATQTQEGGPPVLTSICIVSTTVVTQTQLRVVATATVTVTVTASSSVVGYS